MQPRGCLSRRYRSGQNVYCRLRCRLRWLRLNEVHTRQLPTVQSQVSSTFTAPIVSNHHQRLRRTPRPQINQRAARNEAPAARQACRGALLRATPLVVRCTHVTTPAAARTQRLSPHRRVTAQCDMNLRTKGTIGGQSNASPLTTLGRQQVGGRGVF
jgi:hypothetical protein